METLIFFVGLFALFAAIGILHRIIVKKDNDVINNAIKHRMDEKKNNTTEDLSDRYK